jgi:hypothetical protein
MRQSNSFSSAVTGEYQWNVPFGEDEVSSVAVEANETS